MYMLNIPPTKGNKNRRITVQASLRKKERLPKLTRAKRAGGVAQAVNHLLSKCKALSLNPSIFPHPKKGKKEKRKEKNCNKIAP
jgi:hypothetical protein